MEKNERYKGDIKRIPYRDLKRVNIPIAIPITEIFRFLVYLKCVYSDGFIKKSEINSITNAFGKSVKTTNKYVSKLLEINLIGENLEFYFLRSWRFILFKLDAKTLQALNLTQKELLDKSKYEALILSAKIRLIEKQQGAAGRMLGVPTRRGTYQTEISTGALSSLSGISAGKVTQIKKHAIKLRLIKCKKQNEKINISPNMMYQFKKELPGLFAFKGSVFLKKKDLYTSSIDTRKKKFWSTKDNQLVHK